MLASSCHNREDNFTGCAGSEDAVPQVSSGGVSPGIKRDLVPASKGPKFGLRAHNLHIRTRQTPTFRSAPGGGCRLNFRSLVGDNFYLYETEGASP